MGIAFHPCQTDLELLKSLADYRFLTVRQLAVLHRRNDHATGRRLRRLNEAGVVRRFAPRYAAGRGRPEQLWSLTSEGVNLLRSEGVVDRRVPASQITPTGDCCVDHELLVAEVRIQLAQMERFMPGLHVDFDMPPRASAGPSRHAGRSQRSGQPWPQDLDEAPVRPDGTFAIRHEGLGKTLLFFLEVDMGTETLASAKRPPGDVQQKMLSYRAYWQSEQYKRYEEIWSCQLRGFRLLFVTPSATRLASLCRLTQRVSSSGFVWLTDSVRLHAQGVWSPIWARGGRMESPAESILGSAAIDPSPPPADVR